MIILLHTSKTMRTPVHAGGPPRTPQLLQKAQMLAEYLKTLTPKQLTGIMHISTPLAMKTHATLDEWNTAPGRQSLAIDSFVGDIYSGLRASTLTDEDRHYADEHLRILSGLYGILRPYDGISPYRLEMGYKLLHPAYRSLYDFWDDAIARCLPDSGRIINLAAAEYSKTVTPFVGMSRVVTPKFLTEDPKTGEPGFVVVHAKIARGAFARWLITSRASDTTDLTAFTDIGYRYDATRSTPAEPVFICREFGGKGLSMRLEK